MTNLPQDNRPDSTLVFLRRPYTFIPQGGGDHFQNHRCAGEWITIELMKTSLNLLVSLNYNVPEQNLNIDSRLPAIPKSRFVISRAEPT